MKVATILSILLLIFVLGIDGAQRCRQAPRRQNCHDRRDEGQGRRIWCRKRKMWYYENGQCRSMNYKGCRGNGNRYCKKADCERKCRRAG